MSYKEAAVRALVTFGQAAFAIVVAGGLTGTAADLGTVRQAALAGLVAVVTLLHRGAQAWLEARD